MAKVLRKAITLVNKDCEPKTYMMAGALIGLLIGALLGAGGGAITYVARSLRKGPPHHC